MPEGAKVHLHWGLCSFLQGLLAGAPGTTSGNTWDLSETLTPCCNYFHILVISCSTKSSLPLKLRRIWHLEVPRSGELDFPIALLKKLLKIANVPLLLAWPLNVKDLQVYFPSKRSNSFALTASLESHFTKQHYTEAKKGRFFALQMVFNEEMLTY